MKNKLIYIMILSFFVFFTATTSFTSPGSASAQSPTNTRTPTPINIGNFVWDDLDQDGTQDAGEPGLAGVSVQLWKAAKYQLINTPTPTRTPTPINIGNFVWDDLDQDGTQDAGEPGLAGVSVQLWNAAKNQLINSTSTSASGAYTLVAPIPGNYRVRVVLPSALDAFSPKDAALNDQTDSDINPSGVDLGFTDTFNIASNVISTTIYDAGIIKFRTPTPTRTPTPINIGNFVWDDLDQDGTQDAGEPGLAGVSVQLWNAAKNQLINSTSTSASGAYTLVAPIPGNYRVRVVLPSASDAFSPKDAAVNDQTDSDINPSGVDLGFTDTFNIASNVISTTIYDAGIIKFKTPTPTRTPTPINIGNLVWHDLNGNGIQDAGEPGIAGMTVQLWNAAKNNLIFSAVTNANGNYTVIAPVPGDYRVRVVPFSGSSFSPKNQGADDTKDSDINASIFSADYGFSDIFTIATNVISTTIYDAGLSIVGPTLTPTRTPTPVPGNTSTPSPTPGIITTGVFRPSNGAIYLKKTNTSGFADSQLNYGTGGDYPVAGDWDGNGTATIGIYRNGVFYLRNSNTIGFADFVIPFGAPGDQPVVGDWDGNGIDTIGIYRYGTFYLRNSNSAGAPDISFSLGNPGDVGIAGDWNADGMDTTGVFRPSNGVIFLKNFNTSGFADVALNYGLAGDKPVIGDWDGNGTDTIGIYRNATFYLRNSNTNGFADLVFALGNPGDMPIAGNWGLP